VSDTGRVISFKVIPGSKGPTEAEQRLRGAGFTRITRSSNGQLLHVIAPRRLVEGVLGFSLHEKRRRSRGGTAERDVVSLELPEGTTLPPILRDVVEDIIFPVAPDHYFSAAWNLRRQA
jgi:hypothetical protein